MLPRLVADPDPALAAARAVAERVSRAGAPVQIAVASATALGDCLDRLARIRLPWSSVGIWQVHERIVGETHDERDWTLLWGKLAVPAAFSGIPVDPGADAAGQRAAERYGAQIAAPPCRGVFDLVLLDLHPDGGIAAIDPGSPLLRERRDVAPLAGRGAAVTLTLPCIARARAILVLAEGGHRAAARRKLLAGDASIPAGRLRHPDFTVFAEGA